MAEEDETPGGEAPDPDREMTEHTETTKVERKFGEGGSEGGSESSDSAGE